MLMNVVLPNCFPSIARLTSYFPHASSGFALTCSNHRSRSSRAASFICGSSFTLILGSFLGFSTATFTDPNRNVDPNVDCRTTGTISFFTTRRGFAYAGLGASIKFVSTDLNTGGFTSLQCVPGGIGSTIRSSRSAPPSVLLGNQ
jgi:hypothetical protein